MNKLSVIWRQKGLIFYIFHSIIFNFVFLPFKQAVKLPILLNKPKFYGWRGKIRIETEKIKPGMILLGVNHSHIFPNSGILIENSGTIIFKGKCVIGNSSYISVREGATLTFGSGFKATAQFKTYCTNNITFGEYVLIGWDSMILDSDSHKLKFVNEGGGANIRFCTGGDWKQLLVS